jgi:hypothetical protein
MFKTLNHLAYMPCHTGAAAMPHARAMPTQASLALVHAQATTLAQGEVKGARTKTRPKAPPSIKPSLVPPEMAAYMPGAVVRRLTPHSLLPCPVRSPRTHDHPGHALQSCPLPCWRCSPPRAC